MNQASQEKDLLGDGVPLAHIYRDLGCSGATLPSERKGWRDLRERIQCGDVLTVCDLARLGRQVLETVSTVHGLRNDGIRLRSLDPVESIWVACLEADQESPEYFIGTMMLSAVTWVAQQERLATKNRTIQGLANAAAQGRYPGRPHSATEAIRHKAVTMRSNGASHSNIAKALGHPRSTVRNWLRKAGVG